MRLFHYAIYWDGDLYLEEKFRSATLTHCFVKINSPLNSVSRDRSDNTEFKPKQNFIIISAIHP
jgi:hypothetical protein